SRPQLVTAASLIDAIITHQINQPVDQGGPGPGERGHLPSPQSGMMNPVNPAAPGNRAGDRLFQMDFNQKKVSVSPRLDVSSNGKVSPATASIMSRSSGLKLSSPGGDKPPVQMTLNEQIESMMHNLTASPYETQAWKLRRALAKEEEHQHHHRNPPPPGGRYYGDPVPTMSPLDYVKNRIAEVMRTSEEDKGPGDDEGPHPHSAPSPQRHMMVPSPYSMMQQASSPGPPIHHPPPMHDPGKPLMSDQFEALSDDD
ncbi:hypothetical protein WDU94_010216, partial [Cyamophila willieti]